MKGRIIIKNLFVYHFTQDPKIFLRAQSRACMQVERDETVGCVRLSRLGL